MEFFQVLCMVKICKINTQNVPSLANKMVLESVALKISLWEAQILRPLSKHTAKPRSQLLSMVKSEGRTEAEGHTAILSDKGDFFFLLLCVRVLHAFFLFILRRSEEYSRHHGIIQMG